MEVLFQASASRKASRCLCEGALYFMHPIQGHNNQKSPNPHIRSPCAAETFGSTTKVVWENSVDTDATMHTVTQTGVTKLQVT